MLIREKPLNDVIAQRETHAMTKKVGLVELTDTPHVRPLPYIHPFRVGACVGERELSLLSPQGVLRLNWWELLFGEAKRFTTKFCALGHAMSINLVTPRRAVMVRQAFIAIDKSRLHSLTRTGQFSMSANA